MAEWLVLSYQPLIDSLFNYIPIDSLEKEDYLIPTSLFSVLSLLMQNTQRLLLWKSKRENNKKLQLKTWPWAVLHLYWHSPMWPVFTRQMGQSDGFPEGKLKYIFSLLPSQDAARQVAAAGFFFFHQEQESWHPVVFLIIPPGLRLMRACCSSRVCLIIMGRATQQVLAPHSPEWGGQFRLVNKDKISSPAGSMLAEFKTLKHIVQNAIFSRNWIRISFFPYLLRPLPLSSPSFFPTHTTQAYFWLMLILKFYSVKVSLSL